MYRILILLFLIPASATSQRLIIDVFGGAGNYQGDLQSKVLTLENSRPAFALNAKYEVLKNLYVRTGFTVGAVAGFDANNTANNRARNLSFRSTIFEYALGAEYHPFDFKGFSPYVFIETGFFNYNPYTYYATATGIKKAYLQPLSTEGQGLAQYPEKKPYKLFQFCVPYGVGLKYEVTKTLSIGLEFRQTKLFTDYLDDVSGTYADRAALLAAKGQLAVDLAWRGDEYNGAPYPAAGRGRGNPKAGDLYYFGGITVGLRFRDEAGNFSLGGLFNGDRSLFKKSAGSRGYLKQTDCPKF